MSKFYTITWEIEFDAESPEEAARMALEVQRDKGSTLLVFDVTDGDTSILKTIDLEE